MQKPLYERRISKPLNDAYTNEPVFISKLEDDKLKTAEADHSKLLECWLKERLCAFYVSKDFIITNTASALLDEYKKMPENLKIGEGIKNIVFIHSTKEVEQGFYIIYENPAKIHVFYGKRNAFYYAATFNAPIAVNNGYEYNICKYEQCIRKIIKTRWFTRRFDQFDVLFFLREDYANLIVVDERYKTINRIIYSLGVLKLFPFESLELGYKEREIKFNDGKIIKLKMIDIDNAKVIVSLEKDSDQKIKENAQNVQVIIDVISNSQLLSFIYTPFESFYLICPNWK
ncbi:MAG: hypothetical protein QXI89_00660 [Candidatus Anstonellales archaeon]